MTGYMVAILRVFVNNSRYFPHIPLKRLPIFMKPRTSTGSSSNSTDSSAVVGSPHSLNSSDPQAVEIDPKPRDLNTCLRNQQIK